MSHSQEVIEQVYTTNDSIVDVWSFVWADKTFQKSFIGFCTFFVFIWIIAAKYFEIKDIEFIGYPTAGFTTWIDYINLPNGGAIEFPVGNMTSVHGTKARSNGRIYPADLNP